MLKTRVATAIALLVPLLAVLFLLDSIWVAVFFGAFVAAAAWEFAALAGLASKATRLFYAAALVLLGAVFLAFATPGWILGLFIAAAAWWLLAFIALARAGAGDFGLLSARPARLLAGAAALVPAWAAIYLLHAEDGRRPAALLALLMIVWLADSAAYLFGHLFGRRKLAPRVSPGKTVEGLIGGVLTAMAAAAIYGKMAAGMAGAAWVVWVMLAGAVALVSALGDLVESKFKRLAGVKDSGSLLPGHGGVLDRIDAITSAAPVFVLGWLWLEPPL